MKLPDMKRLFIKNGHYIIGSIVILFIIGSLSLGTFVYIMVKNLNTQFLTQFEKQGKHIDNLKAGISQDNIRRRNIIVSEKIIAQVNPSLQYDTRVEYATYIVDEIERHPVVPLALALTIASCESGFNKNAKTNVIIDGKEKLNAVGIYQIVPGTGEWIASLMGIPYSDSSRFDPRVNIRMGIWYLNWLIDRYGNYEYVIAHYLDGNVGVNALSNRRIYGKTDEYNKMTRDDIKAELNKITIPDTGLIFIDQSNDPRYKTLVSMLKAKEMPLQTENGIPKYMNKYRMIDAYINKSDIYLDTSDSI